MISNKFDYIQHTLVEKLCFEFQENSAKLIETLVALEISACPNDIFYSCLMSFSFHFCFANLILSVFDPLRVVFLIKGMCARACSQHVTNSDIRVQTIKQ